jgi:MraZ protein
MIAHSYFANQTAGLGRRPDCGARGGRSGAERGVFVQGLWAVFLSTFEKQLDAKRRLVVPQEFRALAAGPFDGVFCFPSIEADCIEGGGKALFDRYVGVIEELPFGDPLRSALETSILGGMAKLSFDPAGRITLPETLCDLFGLTDEVVLVGLGDRFQIWGREAFQAHRAAQRELAREGLAELRAQQRAAKLSGSAG